MNENAKTYPQEAFRFLAAAAISGADGGQATSKERSLFQSTPGFYAGRY